MDRKCDVDDNDENNNNNKSSSEDEGTDDYRRGGYHAVWIGDSFKDGRYVVQSKLGWGNFSTVWLAWDTHKSIYVALKVQKSAQQHTEAAMEEIAILKQIAEGDPEDKKCVVKLLDHFKHSGPNGQHICMVFEYLGDNLLTLIKYSDYKGLPLHMVKEICYHILVGLDYLHSQLSMMHTDLKPENILLLSTIDPDKDPRKSGVPPVLPASKNKNEALKDPKGCYDDLIKNQKIEFRKKVTRAARKRADNDAVGESKRDFIDEHIQKIDERVNNDRVSDEHEETKGHKRGNKFVKKKLLAEVDLKCKLVDFGNACFAQNPLIGEIQTYHYRCPEVILGSQYSTPADMWSLACICFELATGELLFDPHAGKNYDQAEDHLALMMELLGTIPRKVALGGRNSRKLFNRFGDLLHIRRLKLWPLREVLKEKYKLPEQDADEFAGFLVQLLDYVPEKRLSAAQCLVHPWISGRPSQQLIPTTSEPTAIKPHNSNKRDKGQTEVTRGSMVKLSLNNHRL